MRLHGNRRNSFACKVGGVFGRDTYAKLDTSPWFMPETQHMIAHIFPSQYHDPGSLRQLICALSALSVALGGLR